MNDYSIRRYSLGWKEVTEKIKKRYKDIPKTDEEFESELLVNALKVTKGSLRNDIECFAKELKINTETLANKYNPLKH